MKVEEAKAQARTPTIVNDQYVRLEIIIFKAMKNMDTNIEFQRVYPENIEKLKEEGYNIKIQGWNTIISWT